ncbi:MAG TPA: hypothetical protein VH724_15715 [Candidatus Angelobacter sp.]|nr:hypothetical protein [Candidatus Angelobacter sp.]
MRDVRKKLYNTAERLDGFLDNVLKMLSPDAKMGIVFLLGGLAALAAWMGKNLLACICILLGCGIAIWLSR